ncbi:MAG: Energy-coupling factor transporter transrane protein EcfT [Actinomycetota bacterium]
MPSTHHHGHDVGERLYVHGHSLLHRLPPEVKLVALLLFLFAVVATPAQAFWAFGVYAVVVAMLAWMARVPLRVIAPRMIVEVPFVIFAVLLPIFGTDPRIEVAGLSLSEPGLIAGWNILIKGTLGVVMSILLAATTPARDLLAALERLRVPPLLVQIASFMLRYVHVVGDEMHRMKIARDARGFRATGVRSWPVIAHSAGALFIRSYERGERVHLAMLSRGYTGRLPVLIPSTTSAADWRIAMVLPIVGVIIALAAWMSVR